MRGTVWMRPFLSRVLPTVVLAALVAPACKPKVDNLAAKERVFSPEDPARHNRAALRSVDSAQLAQDPALARRILSMPADEAAMRLGPHKLVGKASFEWQVDGKRLGLDETRTIALGKDGSWSVTLDNDRDQGYDLIQADGRIYFRSKYLPFRERLHDRGQGARMRDENYAGVASFAELCGWRLALTSDAAKPSEDLGGRKALRYTVGIAERALPLTPHGAVVGHLPAVVYPAGGADKQVLRRAEFESGRTPKSIGGRLWVDAETGVVLKAELDAVLKMTAEPEENPPGPPALMGEMEGGKPAKPPAPPRPTAHAATLTLKLRQSISEVGQTVASPVPEGVSPDMDRPAGIAAALKRFDMDPNGKPLEKPERQPEPQEDPTEGPSEGGN